MKKNSYFLVFILLSAVFLGACSLPWQKKKIEPIVPISEETPVPVVEGSNSGQMKKFANYEELKSFLDKQAASRPTYYRNSLASGGRNIDMALSVSDSAMSATKESIGSQNSNASSDDYSRTNVQVQGVDEADIIKTDGKYIYAVIYNDLHIIKAFPAGETAAVAKISFSSRPSEIYLDGGRLVVIGADSQIMNSEVYRGFRRQSPYTFVNIFDLSDPAAPKQIRTLDFEGSYRDSRLVAGNLYLILNNYNNYVSGETLVPRLVDGGKILSTDCAEGKRCFAPDVYYFDVDYDAYNFVSLNSLDLKTPDAPVFSQTYLLSNAQNIYVSAKNLFIAYTQYLDAEELSLTVMRSVLSDKLSAAEKERLAKIDAVDNDILNKQEKRQKLMQIFESFLSSRSAAELTDLEAKVTEALQNKYKEEEKNLERTVIHKFALNGGQPTYRANGSVPGAALNQFSFDEDEDGNFRLATTRSRNFTMGTGASESYSNLFILSPELKLLGSVENLAPGERIYSVRFLGKRAYLVTFKQTDPLFVIDLSNATAPKLLGELKVPGFSNYLHPYDENTLIGLGKDVQTDVYGNIKTGGVKLSLFDVSDPANPRELDTYVAGAAGSDSLALYNHKAFLFSKEKNLLSIPVSLTSMVNNYRRYFSGALVFSIENNRFQLRGQIDHSDGGKYQRSDYFCGSSCYDNSVQRALYIQDAFYSLSNKYLKVNSLSDLSLLRSLKLTPDTELDQLVTPVKEEPEVIAAPVEETKPSLPVGPILPPPAETPVVDPLSADPLVASSSGASVGNDTSSSSPLVP